MMITPEAIREVFDKRYDALMAGGDSDEASRFASDTKKIAIALLPEPNFLASKTLVRLLFYLDNAILKAEVVAYNAEWDVDLKMEPEQEDASK